MYPFVILVIIVILIFVLVIKNKKDDKYKNGIKVANTQYIKSIPYYKEIVKKQKFFSAIVICFAIISIIFSSILIARPVTSKVTEETKYSRDIFLCMDVSTSVNDLNENLVSTLKDTVKNLQGDRVGISIFNTSSTLIVPLTDDYDYVLDTLENLQKALKVNNEADYKNEDFYYLQQYIRAGTLVGNPERGSSIISDGLASCVYNFPDLNENRSRIIIFSTDNEMSGEPIITLSEAANLCKEKNITVYPIAPSSVRKTDLEGLKNVAEVTGGEVYTETTSNTTTSIVKNINEKAKSVTKTSVKKDKVDVPFIPFTILVCSILILVILDRKVIV
jgi:von willebrand factor type A domain